MLQNTDPWFRCTSCGQRPRSQNIVGQLLSLDLWLPVTVYSRLSFFPLATPFSLFGSLSSWLSIRMPRAIYLSQVFSAICPLYTISFCILKWTLTSCSFSLIFIASPISLDSVSFPPSSWTSYRCLTSLISYCLSHPYACSQWFCTPRGTYQNALALPLSSFSLKHPSHQHILMVLISGAHNTWPLMLAFVITKPSK